MRALEDGAAMGAFAATIVHCRRSAVAAAIALLSLLVAGCSGDSLGAPLGTAVPSPASGVQPVTVIFPTWVVNFAPVGCHELPVEEAASVDEYPPGIVQAMDASIRRGGETWHREIVRRCWTRTDPGPVRIFAQLEEAERFARSLQPAAAATPEPNIAGCPSGCAVAPPGCTIKALVDARGVRRYFLPNSDLYDHLLVQPERGDRWFCAAAEAEAAGWRGAAP